MLISWDWLNEYVKLDMTPAELAERLMMAGLNHEDTHAVGDDLAINLEVTSNRPDCLGHIGIAREAAVLFDRPLMIPKAGPRTAPPGVAELTRVRVDNPRECPRYTARVVRGVKVGPSPAWLRQAAGHDRHRRDQQRRRHHQLRADGVRPAAARLRPGEARRPPDRRPPGPRRAKPSWPSTTRPTRSTPASASSPTRDAPSALGGVMGGADTEVSERTTELLIEAAEFDPLSIRNTARKLNLHSDSSYRFERGLDPAGSRLGQPPVRAS